MAGRDGVVLALANQNRAPRYRLPAESFDAEPLRVRVASVPRTPNSFFVCHKSPLKRSGRPGKAAVLPGVRPLLL